MTDAMQTREKIISIIKERGPILPVQVARETGLSILFASAFLSELYSEKEVNMSNIRVGSSPLYFISGQEPQLKKFSQYLKGKEKEAFIFLKEKKVLKDSALQPAIRVALKEIKDFAIPFQKNDEILWRYFLVEEPSEVETKIIEEIRIEQIREEPKIEEKFEDKEETEKGGEEREISTKEKIPKKQKIATKSKKPNKKKDENFFNKIKESLSKKGIEILDIKDFKNDEAILRVKKGDKEELIFAFNKKKITEKEILKANKRASEEKMPYSIFSLGEAPKKLIDLISAIQNLSNIENIED
jgi:hypothetical protein